MVECSYLFFISFIMKELFDWIWNAPSSTIVEPLSDLVMVVWIAVLIAVVAQIGIAIYMFTKK